MFHLIKPKIVKEFERELNRVISAGYIHSIADIKGCKFPGAIPKVVGVEILFADAVTDKQYLKVKEYIENEYKFVVDEKTLTELGKLPKIMLVWYES